MTVVVGIDPGRAGGIAFCEVTHQGLHLFSAHPMPELGALIELLQGWDEIHHVFLEKAQAMPKNGAVSMFNYGTHFGELRGMLTTLKIPHTLVTPAAWTRVMHEGTSAGKPKERSLIAARRLFPLVKLVPEGRAKKPHDGMVDALLISEYGRRSLGLQRGDLSA